MPIYEFVCNSCGEKFETIVSIGKEKEVSCIHCSSHSIQKCVSSFGIGGGSSLTSSSSGNCSSCSSTSCSTCR
ncbi:MAG: FmdB family zinc ribbon protein [Candidatus Bathyarchaeia archaeon]